MKKHIEKKFLLQTKPSDEVMEVVKKPEHSSSVDEVLAVKKFPKDYNAFVITESNLFFKTFPYEYQGATRFIPEQTPF